MSSERLFLDTAYVEALFNKRDKYHDLALTLVDSLRKAKEVWTTEAILLEVGNALSVRNRSGVEKFIRDSYADNRITVVALDTVLLMRGLDLFSRRLDKEWSLTDCISFVVMGDNKLSDAMSTDAHFRQAGFKAIMRDEMEVSSKKE